MSPGTLCCRATWYLLIVRVLEPGLYSLAKKQGTSLHTPLLPNTHPATSKQRRVFTTAPAVTHPLASWSLSGEIHCAEQAQCCSVSQGLGSFIPTIASIYRYQTTANRVAFPRAGAHNSQTQTGVWKTGERAEGEGWKGVTIIPVRFHMDLVGAQLAGWQPATVRCMWNNKKAWPSPKHSLALRWDIRTSYKEVCVMLCHG